jgi:hypothetical protein
LIDALNVLLHSLMEQTEHPFNCAPCPFLNPIQFTRYLFHASIIQTSQRRYHKNRVVRDNSSMTIGKGKRPRDTNQLAKWIVDRSTAESSAALPAPATPASLSAYMAAMGRKGGQIGGKRRLVTMTAAQRKRVAAKAAKARWKKQP